MRGLAFVLLLVGCDGVWDLEHIPTHDAGDDPLAIGLVARFPMESADSMVEDVAGAHDGICAPGQCPTPVVGVFGMALQFNGISQFVNAPSSPELDSHADFSIAVWARVDMMEQELTLGCVVSKLYGVASAGTNSWHLCTFQNSWHFITLTTSYPIGSEDYGMWHHFAVTWSAASPELRLYRDGFLADTKTADTQFDSGHLVIGADIDNNSTLSYLPGTIDELRIYTRVLTGAEVRALATAP